MAGQSVQFGNLATACGPAKEGFGEFVTVEALAQKQRATVLEKLRPELVAKGVAVLAAKDAAAEAEELLRRELHTVVGGDGLPVALAVLREALAKSKAEAAEAAKAKPQQPQAQASAKR